MEIGSFSVATGVTKRHTITQSTKGVMLHHTFRAPEIVSGEIDADIAVKLATAFENAFNGRISVKYVPKSDSGRPTRTLIEGRNYVHTLMFLASALGGRIVINPVDDNVLSNTDFIAEAYLPFSNDGTIRLDNGATIVMEFEGFSNAAVTGGTGNYDGSIVIDARVSPINASSLLVVDSKLLISGQTGEFDINGYAHIQLPPDITKMSLTGRNGMIEEIAAPYDVAYTQVFCKPVFNTVGFERVLGRESFAINIVNFGRANVKAVSSTEVLLLTAVAL